MLTEQQEKTIENFNDFLSSNNKYFIINGSAGTGKSYLLSYIIKEILADSNLRYYVTATTHKACDVLFRFLKNVDVQTIHSLLGLVITNDFTNGVQKLKLKKNARKIFNAVIFIDECSMIDDDLFSFLEERTINCKIVFIGDWCQLPPVNQKISAAYTIKDDKVINNLTEVVRNEGKILELSQNLRHVVESGKFSDLNIDNKEICVYNEQEFTDALEKEFHDVGNNRARILCYTNNRCQEYTKDISEIRGNTERLQANEYYMCANSLHVGSTVMPADAEMFIVTKYDKRDLSFGGMKVNVTVCDIIWNGDEYSKVGVINDYNEYTRALKLLAQNKDWKEYFRLKESIADLRPIEVSTVHKAQGSTLDRVYIDISDLSSCYDPYIFARLLYVAVSRAKEKVIFYGSLDSRYGKLLVS